MRTDPFGVLKVASQLALAALTATAAERPLPAFPGAEGWGCDTPG